MMNENIFESATRNKYRFPFRGIITVEDLWDLTPEQLDSIFKTLNSQKKKSNEESLLAVSGEEDIQLNNMIEIVKHVVTVKLTEAEARNKAAEKREQKQKILAILNEKQDAALHDKSVEELQAMLANI